ncbi:YrhK family protein [Qaidamihabitans albus]|uniref:YrhK family protein n=1 Tax=Qaidamihabitans albus TaxID=2795733 RepID=UPI0018F23922|nr:YrhK family protein [Qaidamihabitans albus]
MPTGDPHDETGAVLLRFGHEELVVRQRYEVISIVNDLLIAVWFVVGSVLFFSESTATAGTWLFLLGSIQLLIRPAIRLRRRIHLRRLRPGAPAETARDF